MMQHNEIDTTTLRRLAELKPGHPVLSLDLGMTPSRIHTYWSGAGCFVTMVGSSPRHLAREGGGRGSRFRLVFFSRRTV